MKDKFRIDFVSRVDSENLFIEIAFEDQMICRLDKERGSKNIDIEFYSDIFYLNKKDAPKAPLDLFIEILSENKKDLIDN